MDTYEAALEKEVQALEAKLRKLEKELQVTQKLLKAFLPGPAQRKKKNPAVYNNRWAPP